MAMAPGNESPKTPPKLLRSLAADFEDTLDDPMEPSEALECPNTVPLDIAHDTDETQLYPLPDEPVHLGEPSEPADGEPSEPAGGEPSEPAGGEPSAEPADEHDDASPKTLRKRENSRNWHKKWISKGVPRVAKDADTKATEKSKKSETTNPKGKGKGIEKNKKEDKKDEILVDPELVPMWNLSKARDAFVTQWIAQSDMPPSNERRKAAMEAWMQSQMRANFLAGRKGVQKWSQFWCARYFFLGMVWTNHLEIIKPLHNSLL